MGGHTCEGCNLHDIHDPGRCPDTVLYSIENKILVSQCMLIVAIIWEVTSYVSLVLTHVSSSEPCTVPI